MALEVVCVYKIEKLSYHILQTPRNRSVWQEQFLEANFLAVVCCHVLFVTKQQVLNSLATNVVYLARLLPRSASVSDKIARSSKSSIL